MSIQSYYLQQLGITSWQLQQKTATNQPQLQQLANEVGVCQKCDLCHSRTQTVFGRGSLHPNLMIVGEAPGMNEDKQGLPFVGRAGQLLTQILQGMNIGEDSVYIANVLKCRPPENRDPTAQEIQQCTPYLMQQIELLQPKVMVALGRHAAHYLLQTEKSLAQLRKQEFTFANQIPLFVSYHPAYLLRNPADKQQAYTDWCRIRQRMEQLECFQEQ